MKNDRCLAFVNGLSLAQQDFLARFPGRAAGASKYKGCVRPARRTPIFASRENVFWRKRPPQADFPDTLKRDGLWTVPLFRLKNSGFPKGRERTEAALSLSLVAINHLQRKGRQQGKGQREQDQHHPVFHHVVQCFHIVGIVAGAGRLFLKVK